MLLIMLPMKLKTKFQKSRIKKNPGARVLGIDPGFGRVGYGLIEERRGRLALVSFGCFESSKTETQGWRLLEIKNFLAELLTQQEPTIAAIEALFFSKNIKTALGVGEARGAILLTLAEAGLPLFELSPPQIKQAVTGYGRAEKGQVARMVKEILGMKEIPRPDDAADALAIAIAALQLRKFLTHL